MTHPSVPERHEAPDVAELRRLAEAATPGVVLGLLDRLAHMTEARDNARTEVERLTALLAEVRATAEHYNGQAYANCSAAILRILDGERIKHWHDLRPGETVCTDCWLVHPDGACDR